MIKEIENILMRRDGISRKEAQERIGEFQDQVLNIVYQPCGYYDEEIEELLMDELGLEPDYLCDLLATCV